MTIYSTGVGEQLRIQQVENLLHVGQVFNLPSTAQGHRSLIQFYNPVRH